MLLKRPVKKEENNYLPVAPGWYPGTEVEHVSVLQNKSQRRGKTTLEKAWCFCLRMSRFELYLSPTENFTYIPLVAIHHDLINTLSSHPVSFLMVWKRWIRRHRRNLGDPVNSAGTYLCLYREAWQMFTLQQVISGRPAELWWFMSHTISARRSVQTSHRSCWRSRSWWKCVTVGFCVILND